MMKLLKVFKYERYFLCMVLGNVNMYRHGVHGLYFDTFYKF